MKLGTTMLIVAAAGSVASADNIVTPIDSLGLTAAQGFVIDTGVSFTDNFEGYAPGPLAGQGGWFAGFDANMIVSSNNPISGNNSGRHVSDGSAFGGIEVNSPLFPGEFGVIAADIVINGGGSLYQIGTGGGGGAGTFFNTRVQFDLNGDITVGQVNAAQTAFEFIDSGANWVVGQQMNIGIGADAAGVLTVALNGATIFTGEVTQFNLTGVGGVIDQWFIFAGNEGAGNEDGTGDTITFDNIAVPTPGAVALVGLAGLAGMRRRRA